MAIVYQKNKKTGTTYVYESISHWDKEKKQSRAKRRCIGKLDPVTKEVIETKTIKSSMVDFSHKFFGATYLLESIGNKIGLINDLRKCFPKTYKQILSIAYYLILEDKNSLSRFKKWSLTHEHPFDENIPSQRSSELFASISDDAREMFFKLQSKRRVDDEFWAYDTTSISSYSNCLNQIKYGVNKDHDPLPQLNIALLYGQKSNLPFYYRKLPGNISDVKTIDNLLETINYLGLNKLKFVLDRGFYSESNINNLYRKNMKFLIGTKTSLNFVKLEIDNIKSKIRSWDNYNQGYDIFAHTSIIRWRYSPKENNNSVKKSYRRMYLHLYFNPNKAIDDERKLNIMLGKLKEELVSNKRISQNEKKYNKYFEIKSTPKKGIKVNVKDDVINDAKSRFGYFTLISNDIKNPITALETYRNKDLVEKAFDDLKNRLSCDRLKVSSDLSLSGKLFVEFISLIHLSYIKKQMQDMDLFKTYTMSEIIDEVDMIECYKNSKSKKLLGEITNKQIDIYKYMNVDPPSSLQ